MVCKFFDKKTGSGISVNEQLARELHKPVFKKLFCWHGITVINMLRIIQLNPSCVWQSTKEMEYILEKEKKKNKKRETMRNC